MNGQTLEARAIFLKNVYIHLVIASSSASARSLFNLGLALLFHLLDRTCWEHNETNAQRHISLSAKQNGFFNVKTDICLKAGFHKQTAFSM